MHNHFIVCGAGRMGRMVCQHLAEHNVPFVAIDRDEEAIDYCQQQNWTLIVGDATEDSALKEAGIQHAHEIASVLSTDADNLYVVISSRLLKENIRIIARANDDKAAEKMQRA
ncbi:MAG: NAD-binding protein [Pirellulaceae bacterium]|nr:NAD-binding protein [Pirellulaceae bacterium]